MESQLIDISSAMSELTALIDGVEVLPGDDGKIYARIQTSVGNAIVVPLRSSEFKKWLSRQYRERLAQLPPTRLLSDLIEDRERDLLELGFTFPVRNRISANSESIVLDYATGTDEAIELTAEGWQSIPESGVIFPSDGYSLETHKPVRGGTVNAFLNELGLCASEGASIIAWLLHCLRDGPYQALVIVGPDKCAIDTLAMLIRDILDPTNMPLRELPKNDMEVAAAAKSSFILGYNGGNFLPDRTQAQLCRVLKDFAFRRCRDGSDEVYFRGRRPVILTCSNIPSLDPELIGRSLVIHLNALSGSSFNPKKDLIAAFQARRPAILGALLDIAAVGLARLADVRLEKILRDVHFERWIAACSTEAWDYEVFLKSYENICIDAAEDILDCDLFLAAFRDFMMRERNYKGTAEELLQVLGTSVSKKGNHWPSSPRAASARLRRYRFENIGVEFDIREGHNRRRLIIASIREARCLAEVQATGPAPGADIDNLNSEWLNTNFASPVTNESDVDGADGADGLSRDCVTGSSAMPNEGKVPGPALAG
jgi:hypothetical protein